jgi:hypothetical protein
MTVVFPPLEGKMKEASILIDMLGNEVHRCSTAEAGMLMPGGTVIGVTGDIPREFSSISLVQEAWDGTVEWTYSHWEEIPDYGWVARCHHDLKREGNPVGYYAPGQNFVEHGNTLVLAHADEIRPDISSKPLLDDIIYEIDWDGNHTPTMFEWHAVQHIAEFGFDEAALAAIYMSGGDWLHTNAISRLGENH